MIEKYFLQLEHTIQEFPYISSLSLKKKIYNARQGFISGTVIFENDCRLDFVEVKNTDMKSKIKYRYQYMNQDLKMIFRYDNAPHYPDIDTFPHYKHAISDVKASDEPSLSGVLTEIARSHRNL